MGCFHSKGVDGPAHQPTEPGKQQKEVGVADITADGPAVQHGAEQAYGPVKDSRNTSLNTEDGTAQSPMKQVAVSQAQAPSQQQAELIQDLNKSDAPASGTHQQAQQQQQQLPNGSEANKAYQVPLTEEHLAGYNAMAQAESTPQPTTAFKGAAYTGDVFTGAPVPDNEADRHQALCSLNILDTDSDSRFDDITRLVCSIFQCPIAIVSLVDKERQWFKSVQGLPCQQTDRSSSFCAWTLLPIHPEVLVVQDATQDIRFRDNPLVTGDPFIRFYAGAPLVSSTSHRLGSLCIIDRKPRHMDAESCNLLVNFAEVVVREIEKEKLRVRESMRLSRQASGLLRAMDCFTDGIMLVDTSTPGWNVLFINDAAETITGISRDKAMEGQLWQLLEVGGPQDRETTLREAQESVGQQSSFTLELVKQMPHGGQLRMKGHFKPAGNDQLDGSSPLIGIPGFVNWTTSQAGMYYFVTLQAVVTSRPDSVVVSQTPLQQQQQQGELEPFDDVQLGPLLGQGAFGKVYRGMWNGAAVAVKVIQHSDQIFKPISGGLPNSANQEAADQSRRDDSVALSRHAGSLSPTTKSKVGELEAMLSVDLSHPNIVQTYKTATRPLQARSSSGTKFFSDTWLVLEFCDKGSLQDAVDRGVFFRPRQSEDGIPQPNMQAIIATAREIASALNYLHSKDVLHGDLTGGNILLISSDADDRGFSAKVADFGLSRVLGAEAINTGTYGTVTHMPPELLTTGKLSKAADVYAFGVLLWEMYTGRRPWGGLMQMQIIFHVTVQKKKLQFPEGSPPRFTELALACMDSESSRRPKFSEALEMLASL